MKTPGAGPLTINGKPLARAQKTYIRDAARFYGCDAKNLVFDGTAEIKNCLPLFKGWRKIRGSFFHIELIPRKNILAGHSLAEIKRYYTKNIRTRNPKHLLKLLRKPHIYPAIVINGILCDGAGRAILARLIGAKIVVWRFKIKNR